MSSVTCVRILWIVGEAAADPISKVRRPAQPVAQPTRGVAKAGANGALVSQTVKDLVAGSGLTFEGAGKHELKGVPDSWRLYCVVARPSAAMVGVSPSKAGLSIKSGNVLGNRIPLTNLKLLVVGGLMRRIIECYGPLLCKVSGPRGGLVKHEEDGAGPKMRSASKRC